MALPGKSADCESDSIGEKPRTLPHCMLRACVIREDDNISPADHFSKRAYACGNPRQDNQQERDWRARQEKSTRFLMPLSGCHSSSTKSPPCPAEVPCRTRSFWSPCKHRATANESTGRNGGSLHKDDSGDPRGISSRIAVQVDWLTALPFPATDLADLVLKNLLEPPQR